MLLEIYKNDGLLPTSRAELFAKGVEHLAQDRYERYEAGTEINIPLADLLDAAERLACFCLLSGCEIVNLDDQPISDAIGRLELEGLPQPLHTNLVRAIGSCGLCDSDGTRQFRFIHRQFTEYLAGRRLAALLPHQARALLSCGLGSKAGVAGPLRETAAFVALKSNDIATWLAECDPEVIGLSDVADDVYRRQATLSLLSKFRNHELTSIRVGHREEIELAGFQYDGAEQDLRPVLRERQLDCDDVLECAVELIESWNLTSMSDDLADLMLDGTAPISAREAAGYALFRIGTTAAKHRVLPLATDHPTDLMFNLKGLALRCNWPEGMTVPELLTRLTLERANNYHGAYAGFLYELDLSGFDARGYAIEGLTWAKQFANCRDNYGHMVRIASRIAIASLSDIDQPGVANLLAEMIVATAKTHVDSLLVPSRPLPSVNSKEKVEESPPVLSENREARRKLLDAIATQHFEALKLWHVVEQTPGLLTEEDFPWMLKRATSSDISMQQRENYAEMARVTQWQENVLCIEAWLKVRDIEPVASRMLNPLFVKLGSEDAIKAKQSYEETLKWQKRSKKAEYRRKLHPSPAERIDQALTLSETKDANFFRNLCQQLTLEEYSTHYGFSRFLTNTPGWIAATVNTRQRIIDSAKRFLTSESDEPERIRSSPLNTIHVNCMAAIWLVMECEPTWLDALPTSWWQQWAWYILRELHPNMSGEPNEPKILLLRTLHAQAPENVRCELETLSTSNDPNTTTVLNSLLDQFNPINDSQLDDHLCERLTAGQIPDDRIGNVARFVLSRNSGQALSTCFSLIDSVAVNKSENTAVLAAVALLQMQITESWDNVLELLERRPDLAPRVLVGISTERHWATGLDDTPSDLFRLRASQIGQLVSLLLKAFPPESDPKDDGRVHTLGPNDTARRLRSQLINWLGEQRSIEAVDSLKALERQFETKYPWLRYHRAKADRAYRLASWTPIPPRIVAELLAAKEKRLICSGSDALDGVVAAIEQYANRLRHENLSDLDNFWNRPNRGQHTPKEEERASEIVSAIIRNYFRDYAVGAEREVQIFRHLLSTKHEGSPGSEVDVLFRVSPLATTNGDSISVPIELKLSHNREARTGLKDQLVERYMSQLDTTAAAQDWRIPGGLIFTPLQPGRFRLRIRRENGNLTFHESVLDCKTSQCI